jgi:hypothetical protein
MNIANFPPDFPVVLVTSTVDASFNLLGVAALQSATISANPASVRASSQRTYFVTGVEFARYFLNAIAIPTTAMMTMTMIAR